MVPKDAKKVARTMKSRVPQSGVAEQDESKKKVKVKMEVKVKKEEKVKKEVKGMKEVKVKKETKVKGEFKVKEEVEDEVAEEKIIEVNSEINHVEKKKHTKGKEEKPLVKKGRKPVVMEESDLVPVKRSRRSGSQKSEQFYTEES